MSQIIVEQVTKSYAQRGKFHKVLDKVCFSIEPGQFVSLLGPSGCGKTTLLNIIAGFIKADGGVVRLGNGRVVDRPGPDRAFVFQHYALFPWMNVRDNLLYPMKNQNISKPEKDERLHELLQLVKLEHAVRLYPHQLSGGMKQRLALVRALACKPEVLLMDEPLAALDYQMRQELQEEMERIIKRDQLTVIMVTHDVEEAVYLSDRVLLMSRQLGSLVEDCAIILPRPRDRDVAAFHAYVGHFRHLLKGGQKEALNRLQMTS
ncbi:MAG: ABC transporter ATP-binding protein SaoA [Syntrophomonas sp.]